VTTQSYSQCIEKVLRYLAPRPCQQVDLHSNYTAASGDIVIDGASPAAQAVRPGSVLEVGTNVMYVLEVSSDSNPIVTVVAGYQGSTDANASSGALVSINPRFTRFDISQAINDELYSLSSPSNGLGQVLTVQLSYIPTFDGYDLGANFDSATSKILGISYAIVAPTKRNPPIRRGDYRVLRNSVDGTFPSGNGLILSNDEYGSRAQPGFPITVAFLAPFSPLVNLSDDLLTVAGVPQTMQDIVAMGAEERLATDREIQRNATNAQPDPRKAPEVPAGGMRAATGGLIVRRQRRIDEERARLFRAWPEMEYR
jgi:hypothetical protein